MVLCDVESSNVAVSVVKTIAVKVIVNLYLLIDIFLDSLLIISTVCQVYLITDEVCLGVSIYPIHIPSNTYNYLPLSAGDEYISALIYNLNRLVPSLRYEIKDK